MRRRTGVPAIDPGFGGEEPVRLFSAGSECFEVVGDKATERLRHTGPPRLQKVLQICEQHCQVPCGLEDLGEVDAGKGPLDAGRERRGAIRVKHAR